MKVIFLLHKALVQDSDVFSELSGIDSSALLMTADGASFSIAQNHEKHKQLIQDLLL